MALRLILGIALLVASGVTAFAQSLPAPPGPNAPRFEVASVKRNRTDPTQGVPPGRAEPGRFFASGWSLRYLITMAYGARPLQIVGAPVWAERDLFDINAKARDKVPQADMLPMVRALLADRFKLRAHLEKREMPIYALVVIREGRFGPGMKATKENCAQVRADGKAPRARPGEFPVCTSPRLVARRANGTLVLEMAAGGITVPAFIENISSYVDRFVIDRTGLKGDFDFLLQFEPPGALSTTSANGAPSLDSAPPFLEAVQRQLGLRLQSARAPVDVLVIDSVAPPTPD